MQFNGSSAAGSGDGVEEELGVARGDRVGLIEGLIDMLGEGERLSAKTVAPGELVGDVFTVTEGTGLTDNVGLIDGVRLGLLFPLPLADSERVGLSDSRSLFFDIGLHSLEWHQRKCFRKPLQNPPLPSQAL